MASIGVGDQRLPTMRLLVMVTSALTDRHRNAIYGAEALPLPGPGADAAGLSIPLIT